MHLERILILFRGFLFSFAENACRSISRAESAITGYHTDQRDEVLALLIAEYANMVTAARSWRRSSWGGPFIPAATIGAFKD